MRVCSVCHRCYEDATSDCIEDGHPVLYETRSGSLELIEGFCIESLLDLGVKGEIYLARHIASRRSCLLTILNAKGEYCDRFLNDAHVLSSLYHPAIADVYQAGTLESGEVFVVAEQVSGQTLRDLLESGGPPDLLSSIELIRGAAEAVHTIHLKGLVHGAIRPENIVVTPDISGAGMVRMQNIDLGGAVASSIISDKFTIDSAVDSLRYFSPEQCSGDVIGPLTDVYSLGIVLYEMLAGSPPFDSAKAVGLIEKHRNERPPDVKIDDFELRMLITHTLTESLNKSPQNRQPSANAFSRQLRHMEQLATHVSTPPPAGSDYAVVTKPAVTNVAFPPVIAVHPDILIADLPSVAPAPIPTKPLQVLSERLQSFKNVLDHAFRSEVRMSLGIENPAVSEQAVEALTQAPSQEIAALPKIASLETSIIETIPDPTVTESNVHQRLSRLKNKRKRFHHADHHLPPQEAETAHQLSEIEPETVAEVSVVAVPSSEIVRSATRVARAVEWEAPEDDIPSMDDVISALSEMEVSPALETSYHTVSVSETEGLPVSEPQIIASQPEATPDPVVTEITVEPSELSDESIPEVIDVPIPVVPQIAAAKAITNTPMYSPRVSKPAPEPSRGTLTVPSRTTPVAVVIDADEITAVTARNRPALIPYDGRPSRRRSSAIRVVVPQPSNDIPFSLTLLGARAVPMIDTGGSIFAAYTPPRVRSIRTMVVGGGLIAAVALFLFGNGGAWNYLSTLASNGSVFTKPEPADSRQLATPKMAVPAPANVKKPAKASPDVPPALKNSEAVDVPAKPPSASPKSLPVKEVHQPPAPATGVKTSKVNKPAEKAPERSAEKKLQGPVKRPEGATRPRIVKVPNS